MSSSKKLKRGLDIRISGKAEKILVPDVQSTLYGARSLREVFCEDEFRAIEKKFPNFTFNLALSEPFPEDNWTDYTGFIHKVLLDNYPGKHEEPEDIEYYFCDPSLMNNAVIKMPDSPGVPKENISFDDSGI